MLGQLLTWWQGLSMVEKRIPNNKTFLVTTCEATLEQLNGAWIQAGMKNSGNKGQQDQSQE